MIGYLLSVAGTITLSSIDFILSNDGEWTIEGPAYIAESFGCIYTALEAAIEATEGELEGELLFLSVGELDFNAAVEAAISEGLHGVACELVEAMLRLGNAVCGRLEVDEDGPQYYRDRASMWNATC